MENSRYPVSGPTAVVVSPTGPKNSLGRHLKQQLNIDPACGRRDKKMVISYP
jgi:hypothetical protein